MKKFLSLVLALIMTMSLVTVSAGAKDFADGDKVTYEEAVNVMSTVKVLDGYADGSFKPQGELTRGAAAKIICNLILGPTTAAELHADTAPFKDVPIDHTFAGYIAYCAKEGIISGYADGAFRPSAPLTGYAFMKMLLGALGYNAETEQYTGANWSINVAKRALNIGLNKGLKGDFNGVKSVNREEAALYAFNTLKATMVEYDEQSTIVVGGATVTLSGKAQDVAWGTGTLNDGNIKKDGFVQFAEKYFPKLVRKDDTDDFGRPTNNWSNNKKDIGAYVNYDLLVAEYTTKVEGGDVYSDIGSNAADFDLTYFVDGEAMSKQDTKEQADQIAKKNDDKMGNSGNGVLTQVFVDVDDEETTITEINTYLAKTDDYNEKKETLKLDEVYGYGYGEYNSAETMELDDFSAIKDYKDGDLVLVTIAKGEVQSIVPAEAVEGVEIDEFSKKAKEGYVKADGEKYEYAETATYDSDVLVDYDANNLDDATFNLYLDAYGYMIGIEVVEADDNYVFITAYDRPTSHLTNKTAEAKAIFTDGTEAVIEVNVSKSSFKPANNDANSWLVEEGDETENTWYSYTKKGDVYTLTYVAHQFQDKTVSKIDSKHISQKSGNTYYYGNADTSYIVVGVDKVNGKAVIDEVETVTTGVKNVSIDVWTADEVKKEAGNTTEADSQGVYTLTKKTGAYIIASIVLGDDGTVSDRYAYMYGEPTREKYNKTEDMYYWDMDAVVDGVKTTVTFKTDLPATDDFTENLYKLSYDKDGYVVDAEVAKHSTTGNDYQWVDEFDPDDTKLIKTSFGTSGQPAVDLTADGETLWITNQTIERGFALADECPAVIVEQDENGDADKVVEYSSVAKAIKALDNYDKDDETANFDGTIIMTVKEGLVTSVILTDTITKDDNNNNNNDDLSVRFVKVDKVNKKVVLDERDQPEGNRAWTDAEKAAINTAVKTALMDAGYEAVADMTYGPDQIVAVNTKSGNTQTYTFAVIWG